MTKTPPDTMVDQAAMLLSTDWFAPYWPVIGIDVKIEQGCFQNGCRDIVLQLMGTATDYYQIDFSETRIEHTRQSMRTLAHGCNLDEATVVRLENLLMHQSGRDQLEKAAWLFRVVYKELLRDDRLDKPIKLAIAKSRRKFSFNDDLDLEQICLQSSTAWDRYIRSLTPGLPATLAHSVTEGLLTIAELTEVLGQLSKSQRELLHLCFCAAAKSKTGVERQWDWAELEPGVC